MDGIYKIDGKYQAAVRIQDGMEYSGWFPSEKEARKEWKEMHRVLNHAKRKKSEAKLYVWQSVFEARYVLVEIKR